MKDNNYEFRVGDEVETVDGMVGKIVSICHCEKCAERGFFEPKWETLDRKYSDYITVYQANYGFPGYRRIGKYVWNRGVDEDRLTKNIFTKENKEMKEIKLTIDGKEVKLTDEQLKILGIEIEEKRKNPFERVKPNERYHYVTSDGVIDEYIDANDATDTQLYKISNYFNDEAFAEQVALHQLLYRKLLKFAYDNGYEDTAKWDGENPHWCIYYDNSRKKFDTTWQDLVQYSHVYFSTREGTERAIKEVVEPFVKEHPDFVW